MSMFLSFSTRVILHLLSISSLDFLYPLVGLLIHSSIANLLVILALLFDFDSTQSQILDTNKKLFRGQFSANDIFSTPIQDLPRTRLIQKSRNLLTLLKRDTFYPLSTWPQDNQ